MAFTPTLPKISKSARAIWKAGHTFWAASSSYLENNLPIRVQTLGDCVILQLSMQRHQVYPHQRSIHALEYCIHPDVQVRVLPPRASEVWRNGRRAIFAFKLLRLVHLIPLFLLLLLLVSLHTVLPAATEISLTS